MNGAQRYLLIAAFTCGLFLASEFVWAGSQAVVALPAMSGKKPVWTINIDPSGTNGNAYGSIKIQATSVTGPVVRDRTLRIEIYVNGYGEGQYDEHVTAYLKVPEGSAAVAESIEYPHRQFLNQCLVKVFEDGELLLTTNVNSGSRNNNNYEYESVGFLVIDSDMPLPTIRDQWRTKYHAKNSPFADKNNLPDVRALLTLFPSRASPPQSDLENIANDADLLTALDQIDAVNIVHPTELSSRWLALSNANFTIISREDLVALQKQQEPEFEALARWCVAGGTLIVYGGSQEELPAELDELLRTTPTKPTAPYKWSSPIPLDYQETVANLDNSRNRNVGMQPSQPAYNYTKPPENAPFRFRRHGFGNVVAWHGAKPFPGTVLNWGWLFNSIGSDRFLWTHRHGMSHKGENNDYWNFLVPGIGQTPVYSFMGMIGLFMLLIGPLNYYFLGRIKRLSLLLVTVPTVAFIFTFGLVFFAIFSDGFSSRARVRSFTVLENGRAAAMSRQMIFAAFVPSAGMEFPSDTAVYCLHHHPQDVATGYNQYYFQNDSEWNNGRLQLRRRYLASREQRQFMVLRSTACSAQLAVEELPAEKSLAPNAPGPAIRVTNRLGQPLPMCVLHGTNDEVYTIEDLKDKASVEIRPTPEAELQKFRLRWRAKLQENALEFPVGFNTNQFGSLSRRRWSPNYGNNQSGNYSQGNGVLEQGMFLADNITSLQQTYTTSNNKVITLSRKYFVVLSAPLTGDDQESLVPVGLPGVHILQQSHVVEGSW